MSIKIDDDGEETPAAEPVGHGAGDPFELRRFFPYQLAVLANRMSRRFLAAYRDRYGLNVSEWRVVAHVATAEPVSVREIYGGVNLDKPTVSRAVKRLVAEDLVSSSAHQQDGRLVEISLTQRGRDAFEEISAMGQRIEAEILAPLTEAERRHLGDVFEKLHAALDDDPLAPPRTPF